MTAPRGIRNNNPGNIRYVEGVTSLYLGCIGSDGEFCRFDTAHNGIRALCKLLLVYQDKHGLRTVRGCINRWAPPVENDTSAYVDVVARALNVEPDDEIDLHRDFVLAGMALAIIQHENGQQPYAPGDVMGAAREALGFAYVDPPIVELPPDTQAPAPIEERPQPAPEQPKESSMPLPILALISAFGPLIADLIPAVAKAFDRKSETPQKIEAATKIIDTIVTATGTANVQQAVEKMQADPAVRDIAAKAVVTEPQIMGLLEIGSGGIAEARRVAADPAALPFWKQGAFVVAVILVPLIYMTVYRVLWSADYSEQLRTVVVTAILSGLLGALTGYFFGSMYSSSAGATRRTTDEVKA
jgi:hypothetical protein